MEELEDGMKEIVYVSEAEITFGDQEIIDLLQQCRKNNEAHHITGLLLFDGDRTFVQVIEGEDQEIDQLYQQIENDSRHHSIQLIWDKSIQRRAYEKWEMGYRAMSQSNSPGIEGFSNFMQLEDKTNFAVSHPTFIEALIHHFKLQPESQV